MRKKNQILLAILIAVIHLAAAQNVNYKVYDAGTNDISDDQISKVFQVPDGFLFLVNTKTETVFKLYDHDMKLIKTTPLTHDVVGDRSIPLGAIYKLKDKIVGECWDGVFAKEHRVPQRICRLFEFDLSGKFIRHIVMPRFTTDVEQDIIYSPDSSKMMYWSSIYTLKKTGNFDDIKYMKEDERFVSFKIYDNNFKELKSEDLLLNFIPLEKNEFIKILAATITNEGNVIFICSHRSSHLQRKNYGFGNPVINPSLLYYDYNSRKLNDVKIDIELPARAYFIGLSQLENNKSILQVNVNIDKPTANESLNYYYLLNYENSKATAKEVYRTPLYYRKFFTGEAKFEYMQDTTYGDYEISFNSSFKSKNGMFLAQYGNYGTYGDKPCLFSSFINKADSMVFISNIATKFGLNQHDMYMHKNYLVNDKLATFYYHLKNDPASKSNTYLNYNIIPCVSITDQLGKVNTVEFAKELNIDYADLGFYYQISPGRFISMLPRLKKYLIVDIE